MAYGWGGARVGVGTCAEHAVFVEKRAHETLTEKYKLYNFVFAKNIYCFLFFVLLLFYSYAAMPVWQ